MKQHRLSAAGVATLLTKATTRPVALPTVKSWLVDPEASSSRACPAWVVPALTTAVAFATDEHREKRRRRPPD